MIYQLSALWLLLAAAATAELYDDNDSESAVLYQRHNVDTISVSRLEDMLLLKLIKELMRKELQEESHRFHNIRNVEKSAVVRGFPEYKGRPQRLLLQTTKTTTPWRSGEYGVGVRDKNGMKICYLKNCDGYTGGK